MQSYDQKLKVLLVTVIVLTGGVWLLGPLPQNPGYHDFADQRPLWFIANGLNVLSNLFFLLVGGLGIASVMKYMRNDRDRSLCRQYLAFFAGVCLVGLGSGYYHLAPANDTLFWDRLAMAVAITAFTGTVISELVSGTWGRRLFLPLLGLGAASVLYWIRTEHLGHGDLRPYVLAQFMPFILVLLIVFLYRAPRSYVRNCAWLAGWYGFAKILETYDAAMFRLTAGMVSGHTLKHLAAAAGIFFVVRLVRQRHGGRMKPVSLPGVLYGADPACKPADRRVG